MSEQTPTLSISNVTKRFDNFTAVDNLSFDVKAGRVFGFLGPNGAGKTTTIRMIVNITIPDQGSIKLFGQHINDKLQDRIGYLPEERGLYKKMKISDQLRFFGALKNMESKRIEEQIEYWIERVKLKEWKDKKANELSKGMQQKIQFIAAVMHDPDLVILDEPFSGLDPINVELLKEIVLEQKAKGKTIIFSTHQMETAERLCDDICLINRSRKIVSGSLREVKKSFGRNSIALRAEGGQEILEDKNLVETVTEHSDEVEVLLTKDANAQELLRRLVAANVVITKFELVEPSLNDIFITKVNESNE